MTGTPARAERPTDPDGDLQGRVAIAHDYLTQRGGAERVVEVLARAFPQAPIHTTLFEPAGTFPVFGALDVRPSPLNRIGVLRTHHRLALPLLAPTVARMRIDADVVVASSSGWAHGIPTTGRKVVYCHAPARWLYQRDRYLGADGGVQGSVSLRGRAAAVALGVLDGPLRRWDVRAAHSADRYLSNSSATRDAVRAAYGIESEVLAPPPALLPDGPDEAVPGLTPGFLLCVARLLPYKHVDVVIEAAARLPGEQVVVVGEGPERSGLQAQAERSGSAVLFGRASDAQLRWLYANCRALVAASYEDYGLSPLEAAAFGRPTVALRAGGYLDTVVAGATGQFFERATPDELAGAVEALDAVVWDAESIRRHAADFSEGRFAARLRQIVAEELERR
jgi:glycosyltransferase involved in cell wall biosynthesis